MRLCETDTMRRAVVRALASVRNEWDEAPWFVILTVAVTALVGPGIAWAAWTTVSDLFG